MTAPTHETQVVMADAVIAQVIQLKDPEEAISSAIWWRVAELLRACTTATASGPHLTTTLLEHAFNATDDVLSSLSADTEPSTSLLFSLHATTPAMLATSINQLRRALAAWRFEALDARISTAH